MRDPKETGKPRPRNLEKPETETLKTRKPKSYWDPKKLGKPEP